MKGNYAKASCVALSILLLGGCEIFSEKKMNAYMGDGYREYSRNDANYAYNGPSQPYQTTIAYPQPVRSYGQVQSSW